MTLTLSVGAASAAELEALIVRFVTAARQRCEYTVHPRRRAKRRYHRSWPLMVILPHRDGPAELTVALHNVSVDGVAFLTRMPVAPGSRVQIRPFWHDETCPWVPAIVRHSTPTAAGYLIGCEFVFASTE